VFQGLFDPGLVDVSLNRAEVDVTMPGASAFLLTARERQVLELLLRGLSGREISRSEGLRPQTVKNYVTTIYQKLGVADRAELIEEWGHLTEESPAL
jgi:DNA-binding CsgD family transcriptional regulator